MRRRVMRLSGGLAALLAATAAMAQETERVEPVVVTATKIETPRAEVGASVTVITGEELRTYNYPSVDDALRQVPGVDIQRSGGMGKLSAIRIRGAGTQQVQVMVDGMRVKSPTLGVVDLSELTLDAVERIEIVRGPQSTLHGADAIGGVVNIITRRGRGPVSGTAEVQVGTDATFRERLGVQGTVGALDFNVAGSRWDSDGDLANDAADQTTVAGRVGYMLPWKGELALTGRYTDLFTKLPIYTTIPPPTVYDPNARQETETGLYSATYRQRVLDWWETSARVGQWFSEQRYRNVPPPGAFTTISHIDTSRTELEWLNSFPVVPWTTLTVGAEYRKEHGKSRGEFSEDTHTVSLLVQDELRLLDRVSIVGGLRWDDNDDYGRELTPRVATAVAVKETGTRLRGAWAQGFRAPTINDLFFPGFGNPDLDAERSTSWEVGADQEAWQRRVRLSATYFHTRFKDLIQVVFDPATFSFLPENVGRARARGIEASAEVEPLDWLLLYGQYTWTDTRDKDTGQDLRRVPRHHWNTGLVVTPIPRLSLFVQATVVSSQFETTGVSRNPGHYRLDAGGTLRVLGRLGRLERLELTARIENLTDRDYEEVYGFPAPGIGALVGLRARFE